MLTKSNVAKAVDPEIKQRHQKKNWENPNTICSVANDIVSILILSFHHCVMGMQEVSTERGWAKNMRKLSAIFITFS